MAYFDNYRRRRQGLPTVEDYQKVFSAYQELAGQFEVQGKELHRLQQELQSRMMGTLQPSPIVESNGFETEVRELKRLLEVKSQELAIQKEALHRSGEEARKMESELFFLRAGLEEAQKKLADGGAAEWQERYARLQAEVENLRRRWEQRSAEETAANRRKVLADMVPLADHLDLALQHKPAAGDQNLSAFISNIEATRKAFLDTLRRYGIERIEPTGEPFDPTLHEAIGQTPSEYPADHVATVLQAGYREGDKLLRPARVMVSLGPAATAD
jgi:molecular chaperone GrpE